MQIDIIKTGLDCGAGTIGCRYAPDILIHQGLEKQLLFLNHNVQIINCEISVYQEDDIVEPIGLKHLEPIIKTNERLAQIIYDSYKTNSFPLVLGGDHSILLGVIAGISAVAKERNQKLGILYIDAHGDFNTDSTTPSGNIHGQSLAACCGIGHPKLSNLCYPENKIDPNNVIIVGARSIDPGERILLKQNNVKVYTSSDIERFGLLKIIKDSIAILSENCDRIHLSFDVDSVDPLYAPGTGIHIDGGLTYREIIYIMEELSEVYKIKSADIVEYNPLFDIKGKTANLCIEAIAHLFGKKYF